MKQKIVLHFTYTIFCGNCGEVVMNNVIPSTFSQTHAEFPLESYTCNQCGNKENFNVAKSEFKRLMILPEPNLDDKKEETIDEDGTPKIITGKVIPPQPSTPF